MSLSSILERKHFSNLEKYETFFNLRKTSLKRVQQNNFLKTYSKSKIFIKKINIF